MRDLQFALGDNIGGILLDIASEAVSRGDTDKAVSTYAESLIDFPVDIVKKLLKNEYVLKTSEDGKTLELSDKEEDLKSNDIARDWYCMLDEDVKRIDDVVRYMHELKSKLLKRRVLVNDFNIRSLDPVYEKEINVAAKLIGGKNIWELNGDDSVIANNLIYNYETEEATKEEAILYELVAYAKTAKDLHRQYMELYGFYKALKHFELVEHYAFIEMVWERCLRILIEFCDTSKGYYHPLCNEKLNEYKEMVFEDIMKTEAGREYQLNNMLAKNPADHYDAAWISPEGEFYGAIGETKQMLHYMLAEELKEKKLKEEIKEYGQEAEQYLCDHSWIKLHGNEAYTYLAFDREHAKETGRLFAPTKKQIDALCIYMNKFHNGKFYTEFAGMGSRISHTDPYSTRDIKQMDELALRNAFKL